MSSRILYPKQLLLKETIPNNNTDYVEVKIHFKKETSTQETSTQETSTQETSTQETSTQETSTQETSTQETSTQETKNDQVTIIHFTTKKISDFVFHIDNPNITETIDGDVKQVTEISLIYLYNKIQDVDRRLQNAEEDIGCGNIQNLVCENTPYIIKADGTFITSGGSFTVQ